MILPTPNLTDTTKVSATFPYRFATDLFGHKVIIYRTGSTTGRAYLPSELQRLAEDETLDPHRHVLYQEAWNYWLREQEQK